MAQSTYRMCFRKHVKCALLQRRDQLYNGCTSVENDVNVQHIHVDIVNHLGDKGMVLQACMMHGHQAVLLITLFGTV
jgi:hypothetical protein